MKTRDEISLDDRWNVEAFYPNVDTWEKDFKSFMPTRETPRWPALVAFKGKLGESPKILKEAFDLLMDLDRKLAKLYTYAHLRHDEDITHTQFKIMYEQVLNAVHSFSEETSWFQPEILGLSEGILKLYLSAPILAPYHFYLEKMIRVKAHTLPAEQERLLALAGQAMESPHKAFSAINDADFVFPSVFDQTGKELPLSHGSYSLYIRGHDRILRENAFKTYHQKYLSYENTIQELLGGAMSTHLFQAQARNYPSCLEAALYPKNINSSVYHALIQAVHERIHVLHRYMDVRRRALKLDTLHLYDIYVPLTQEIDIQMTYQEAEEAVIESTAPLGSEYQQLLEDGLKTQRWVDRYENKNKRSGAYSSGCYDSMPYILMNYKNVLKDVFTLAHEAGHSMHSLYSRRTQPYQYSDYPIFLAEVASTFNEDLLTQFLLKRYSTPSERLYLINQQIEDIRGTLFRQTMFAEFELWLHQQVEQGHPLTPDLLKQRYHDLNVFYFGDAVTIDQDIMIEWARIPHFYYNFYVFQYATGISAALALSDQVLKGGEKERTAYLNFLKSGCSKYPLEILKAAGVDMQSPEPVKLAINKFDHLVTELEKLL